MHPDRQNRIINVLLLIGSFIENLGLLNGKMGISICFYHLARKTGNPTYENYAEELLEQSNMYFGLTRNCAKKLITLDFMGYRIDLLSVEKL
jgi:hypothetical protein